MPCINLCAYDQCEIAQTAPIRPSVTIFTFSNDSVDLLGADLAVANFPASVSKKVGRRTAFGRMVVLADLLSVASRLNIPGNRIHPSEYALGRPLGNAASGI